MFSPTRKPYGKPPPNQHLDFERDNTTAVSVPINRIVLERFPGNVELIPHVLRI